MTRVYVVTDLTVAALLLNVHVVVTPHTTETGTKHDHNLEEYSGPPRTLLSAVGPTIFSPAASGLLEHVASSLPPQSRVGALFKPLLPLPHLQEPPAKHSPKSQPKTRPSSKPLNNGGAL